MLATARRSSSSKWNSHVHILKKRIKQNPKQKDDFIWGEKK
jgi:hypothetical protein